MSSKKVFVFTATGDQGKAVALKLNAAGWQVTGLTRNTGSASAKGECTLAAKGILMVQGDLDNPESYAKYLDGVHSAFVNADYMSIYFTNGLNIDAAIETEFAQSRNAVDACVKAGVKHIVFSALDEFEGDKAVPYFVSKARVAKYIRSNNIPATNIYTCTYYSDFLKFHQLVPNKSTGGFTLNQAIPGDVKMPCFDVFSLGDWVLPILEQPEKYIGKDVQVCADWVTAPEMAEILTRVSGKQVEPLRISHKEFYSDEVVQQSTKPVWMNLRSYVEGFFHRDVEASRAVNPKQQTFAEWAAQSEELKQALQAVPEA
ncbi:hypothetical protein EHS25_007459 [Saitozyma podzolica]|uniref:NmrA-like domain-containing protein n=1 Tax=Saitozyma podzolica TaxID=1890683 RepID=A0A427YPY2_9TREE|nr:hypothetical protein EHS25_007459 [Saitozyma podzolica]